MSFTTLDKLNGELNKLAEVLTEDENVVIQKKIAIDIFSGVIERTGVDEGEARGGWQMNPVDEPPTTSTGKKEKGEVGVPDGETLNTGVGNVANIKPWGMIWITNPTVQAMVMDQGLFVPTDPGPSSDPRDDRFGEILVEGGFSVQSPAGIVEPTLEHVLSEVQGE